eukprot:161795-Pelagomonas_calceolata.AAC.3
MVGQVIEAGREFLTVNNHPGEMCTALPPLPSPSTIFTPPALSVVSDDQRSRTFVALGLSYHAAMSDFVGGTGGAC